MKAFTKSTDETEIELEELAIFVSIEEIQELIDFLKYVKEDHIIQRDKENLSVTHNHFSMWKGEKQNKLDLQIWSIFDTDTLQ